MMKNTLKEKERFDSFTREHVCSRNDIKKAVNDAEDFIISKKRENDLQWNMRLNLIIQEFKENIFGRFE